MGRSLITTGNGSTSTVLVNTTNYMPLAQGESANVGSGTESNSQVKYKVAGTLSGLYVRVIANSFTSDTLNIKIRKNGNNGNCALSIAAGATGEFETTTEEDVIAVNDLLAFERMVANTGTGTATVTITRIIFNSPSVTSLKYSVDGLGTGSASNDLFYPFIGDGFHTSTETRNQQVFNSAGTVKNLQCYVSGNARTTNTEVRVREDAGNSSLLITIGSGVTGFLEDSSNTESINAGAKLGIYTLTGTGTGTITWTFISAEVETTNNAFTIGAGEGVTGLTPAIGVSTNFYSLSQASAHSTTESDYKQNIGMHSKASKLSIYIETNSHNASSHFRLRVNGANSSIVATVGAAATGFISDSSNEVTLLPTDEVNYLFDTASVGSGSVTLFNYTILITDTTNIKTIIGAAMATVKTWMGIVINNVKKWGTTTK